MASFEYIGEAVLDLQVVRTGVRTFDLLFTIPHANDGTGEGAQVDVRSGDPEVWWGERKTLVWTNPGEYFAGQQVRIPVVTDFDLVLGMTTGFQAVAFRHDDALGKNVFSDITPQHPGLVVNWEDWVSEPEPQPDPEPTEEDEPVQPTVMLVRKATARLWGALGTWHLYKEVPLE